MNINTSLASAIFAATLAAAGVGHSIASPSAVYSLQAGSASSNSPGSVTDGHGDSASVSDYPNPTLTAQSHASLIYSGTSEASMTYFFSIVGPDTYHIPFDISYSGNMLNTGMGAELGYAETYAYIGLGPFPYEYPGSPGTVALYETVGEQTFSGMITSYVAANGPVEIFLDVYTSSYYDPSDTGYIQLDPVISIDPSFGSVDPNYLRDYTIDLSPGVSNDVSAVPETATWAMMLLGLGTVGVATRRSGRSTFSAIARS